MKKTYQIISLSFSVLFVCFIFPNQAYAQEITASSSAIVIQSVINTATIAASVADLISTSGASTSATSTPQLEVAIKEKVIATPSASITPPISPSQIEQPVIASPAETVSFPVSETVHIIIADQVPCRCGKPLPKPKKSVPPLPYGNSFPINSSASVNISGVSSGNSHLIAGATFAPTFSSAVGIVVALFGNIMMLLLRAYLRLRSGRSPGR